jgi:hypothetical protein
MRRIIDVSRRLVSSIMVEISKDITVHKRAYRSSHLTGFYYRPAGDGLAVHLLQLRMFALACSARYNYILNDDIRTALLGFGKALAFSLVIYGAQEAWLVV